MEARLRPRKTGCCHRHAPGYPPPKVNGLYISDFLTPDGARDYAYPESLRNEIEAKWGTTSSDVVFRADERVQLYDNIRRMTEKRFSIAEELYQRERWDVFAIHEIGVDRIHHAYTKLLRPRSRRFPAREPLRTRG